MNKQKESVYISGKITGLEKSVYESNFNESCEKVKNIYGIENYVNPIKIKPLFGIEKWLFYMVNDIKAQRKCTHSAFQSNWTESRGAVIEYCFAKFIFKQTIIFLQ